MTKQDEKQTIDKEQKIEKEESVLESVEEKETPKEVEKLEQKIVDLENQVKRVLADYQNSQKRALEERKEWVQSANRDLLLQILPVFDTLMLAQKHSEDKTLAVTVGQFLQILKDEGVEKIETVGRNFDPISMEAVTTGEGEEGKVLEELRTGFTLYGKILRPAQVKVGKGK